jgi:hypothetical protein
MLVARLDQGSEQEGEVWPIFITAPALRWLSADVPEMIFCKAIEAAAFELGHKNLFSFSYA